MSGLKRLTKAVVDRAIQKGRGAGFHKLTIQGYLPDEIAIYTSHNDRAPDIRRLVREHANKRDLPIPASCGKLRESKRRPPPNDWRAAFRGTVMRTGMNLHLSQPMLEFLCAVSDHVWWDRHYEVRMGTSSISTGASLAKRGLIKSREVELLQGEPPWELTEAGQHVVDLLKCVGIFVEQDAAIRKRAKASGEE